MGDLRDELTALGRTMLARTNDLADRVAVLERRTGLVPADDPGAPTASRHADAALAAAVSLAWSTLDDVAERVPAGYAWLHDAVRDAREAVGNVADLLRAEAPTADPPTVTPDDALGVMVAMGRGAEEDDPRPAQPSPPSPWRPLPDPECPEDEPVWLTSRFRGHVDAEVAIQRRNGSGTLRWYTYGDRDSGEVIADVLAWMPLPKPWRGGR